MDEVATHYYSHTGDLAEAIAAHLRKMGKAPDSITTADLAIIDEFHIGGRPATLNIAARMHLQHSCRVLDIGSGLGGPARTLAETYGCHVTGIDLTQAFCEAGTVLSKWVGLADLVDLQQGDATNLPFGDDEFDAAMTIHVAMNIPEKDRVYSEARRVLKPSARFVVYDVLQGEGGNILFPVPWARDASISHLATPDQMASLLTGVGFRILETEDSSDRSLTFFAELAPRMMQSDASLLTTHPFLGRDFADMVRNMLQNLREERIRTVTYVCQA